MHTGIMAWPLKLWCNYIYRGISSSFGHSIFGSGIFRRARAKSTGSLALDQFNGDAFPSCRFASKLMKECRLKRVNLHFTDQLHAIGD